MSQPQHRARAGPLKSSCCLFYRKGRYTARVDLTGAAVEIPYQR